MKHRIATKAITASPLRRLARFTSVSAAFVVTVVASMVCATSASAMCYSPNYSMTLKSWSNTGDWSAPYSAKYGPEFSLSNSCIYSAIFQSDGNFVIYHSGRPIWASNTYGPYNDLQFNAKTGQWCIWKSASIALKCSQMRAKGTPPFHIVMQGDGNLVTYDSYGKAVWASDTAGK